MLFKTLDCLLMFGVAFILFLIIGLRVMIGRLLGFGTRRKPTDHYEAPKQEQEPKQKKPANGRPADGKKIFSAQEGEYIDYEEIK